MTDSDFVLTLFVAEIVQVSVLDKECIERNYIVKPVRETDGQFEKFTFRHRTDVPCTLLRAVFPDRLCSGHTVKSFAIGADFGPTKPQIMVSENEAKDYSFPMMLLSESSKIGPLFKYDRMRVGETIVVVTQRLLPEKVKEALDWEDVEDEWSSEIQEAHPVRTGSHDLYAIAMKMIGHRHSKGQLVSLVHWLLLQKQIAEKAREEAVRGVKQAAMVNEILRSKPLVMK